MEDYPAKPQSYDAVYFGSVLEHLEKAKALRMLNKAEKIARQVVIAVTTNGYMNHDETDDNFYQIHRCGFTAKEFRQLGYRVYGDLGWKPLSGEEGKLRIKPVVIGATVRNLTQYITYKALPQCAFNLYAVKHLA